MKDDAVNVLTNAKIATLATVNSDGSPWSTPVQILFRDGAVVWHSGIDAVHSKNLTRDNRISITVFEMNEGASKAVFISSFVSPVNDAAFNEQYQKTMAEYSAPIGELDEAKSAPNRYYFSYSEGAAV